MAILLLACDTAHKGQLVVIKRPRDELAEEAEFLAMFAAEATIATQLDHPNIVRTFEAHEHEGLPQLVMEWLDGVDLRTLLRAMHERGGRIAPPLACYIAREVARGLDYAHHLKRPDGRPLSIVHRDVSPQNVLVTFEGEVKIVDFGIAKSAARLSASRSGVIKGKLEYMSPEQLAALELDGRSDVFALGIILWEMLVGRQLWKRRSKAETIRHIRGAPAPPPSSEIGVLPPALDALTLALLAKLPAGRPTAAAAAAHLDAIVAGFSPTPQRADLASLVARCL
jgi:serine/threonine protein kinase